MHINKQFIQHWEQHSWNVVWCTRQYLFFDHQLMTLHHQLKLVPASLQVAHLFHSTSRHWPHQLVLRIGGIKQRQYLPMTTKLGRKLCWNGIIHNRTFVIQWTQSWTYPGQAGWAGHQIFINYPTCPYPQGQSTSLYQLHPLCTCLLYTSDAADE